MKPTSARGKSMNKSGAKYNGVTLPKDATQRRRMRNMLSAQVHRKRKQDALNTAKQECDVCDVEMRKLQTKLIETRAKAASLQAIMDAIQLECGSEAISHILEKCKQQAGGASTTVLQVLHTTIPAKITYQSPPRASSPTIAKSVSSESDNHISEDEESSLGFGCFKDDLLLASV